MLHASEALQEMKNASVTNTSMKNLQLTTFPGVFISGSFKGKAIQTHPDWKSWELRYSRLVWGDRSIDKIKLDGQVVQ